MMVVQLPFHYRSIDMFSVQLSFHYLSIFMFVVQLPFHYHSIMSHYYITVPLPFHYQVLGTKFLVPSTLYQVLVGLREAHRTKKEANELEC